MANRSPKPKPKPAGVLGTLPASRPERLGRPRNAGARKPRAVTATVGRPPQPKAAKPKPRAKSPKPAAERLGPPTGTELVTTAVRAVGELAQIGVTVGGQVIKRTLSRIPRP